MARARTRPFASASSNSARRARAFSLTIIGPSGRFLESRRPHGSGARVLWITDTTIKGLEESGARARFEEARAAAARDPMAFLEMLGKAPFPAWRMSGAGKLQWVNKAYMKAVGATNMDHVLDRQIMLDQHVTTQAQKTISSNNETDDTRHMVMAGERRAMKVKMFPLSGGLGGMAFDITELEFARETLDRHAKAHDETLNNVADGVAIFGQDRKLIFNNKAFADSGRWIRPTCWRSPTTARSSTGCASAPQAGGVRISRAGARAS